MSKFTLLLFAFILAHYNGLSQQNAIQLKPLFKKDEVRKYHITTATNSFIANGSLEELNSTEKDVSIKITDINNDKIDIEWRYEKIKFINSATQFDPIQDHLNTMNRNMIIKYVVNPKGVIQSILNYNDISSMAKRQVDSLIQKIAQESTDKSTVEAIKFQLEMILLSQEIFDALILEDVYRFHELYGLTFQESIKNLIPEKNVPDNQFAIKLIAIDNRKCKLGGELISSFSDKKGERSYTFELPACWLEYYSSKWFATAPVNVSNSYTITLISH